MYHGTMNILVIDDDREFLYLFKNLINKDDMHVRTATNGMAALEILNSDKIDLVITDAIMPDTPIMSFICTIRNTFPKLPLILISGLPGNPLINNSMILGADEFIAKPINLSQLYSTINKYKQAS